MASIRTNDAGRAYGRAGVTLPAGALLVVSHELPEGTVHFAMERAARLADPPASAWDYAVIDAMGAVVEQGRIPTCVRCHQEAAHDEVFGPGGL